MTLDAKISELTRAYRPLAIEILKETIRVPADYVDKPVDEGGDPLCGTSNHEGPRVEYLRRTLVEIGAVERPEDAWFDDFGNLTWVLMDRDGRHPGRREDGRLLRRPHRHRLAAARPLARGHGRPRPVRRPRGRDASSTASSCARSWASCRPTTSGTTSSGAAARPTSSRAWSARSSRPRCSSRPRHLGSLRGVIVRSYATVAEEDNDGGSMMHVRRHEWPGAGPELIPDAYVLTEGTGCANDGAAGIYRGQRGRMQIEVEVTGKSCHGSMPWEGRNPLELGAPILVEAAARYRDGVDMGVDPFLGGGTRTASWAKLDTPSDCAVPERFTFRFDRRLTAGEDPQAALAAVEGDAQRGGRPRGRLHGGRPRAVLRPAVVEGHQGRQRADLPRLGDARGPPGGPGRGRRVRRLRHARSSRPPPATARSTASRASAAGSSPRTASASRSRPTTPRSPSATARTGCSDGTFTYPPMIGIGVGIEQNVHKIGECIDSREFDAVIATLARFPSRLRELKTGVGAGLTRDGAVAQAMGRSGPGHPAVAAGPGPAMLAA